MQAGSADNGEYVCDDDSGFEAVSGAGLFEEGKFSGSSIKYQIEHKHKGG